MKQNVNIFVLTNSKNGGQFIRFLHRPNMIFIVFFCRDYFSSLPKKFLETFTNRK
ncbi:MAG: hypothetical protein ACI89U_002068 [Gammaproteobacteria bacterium]|jgi:hypothetical protein